MPRRSPHSALCCAMRNSPSHSSSSVGLVFVHAYMASMMLVTCEHHFLVTLSSGIVVSHLHMCERLHFTYNVQSRYPSAQYTCFVFNLTLRFTPVVLSPRLGSLTVHSASPLVLSCSSVRVKAVIRCEALSMSVGSHKRVYGT